MQAFCFLIISAIAFLIPSSTGPINGTWIKSDGQKLSFDSDGDYDDQSSLDSIWELDGNDLTIISSGTIFYSDGSKETIEIVQDIDIYFSDDENAKEEVRKVSTYVFKQILVLLHPFIPFVTEEIWLKNKFDNKGNDFLMFKNWISAKSTKDSHTDQVENIINIISELRSFKNELNVSPGSFIDISINNINKDQKQFISSNEIILKKLGRINNILSDDLDKPAATMVVSGDLFKIYFDKDVDLKLIKENLTSKQERLEQEMHKISQRLENKSFVDRAPKEIVEQEKTNYNNLKNDVDKISITIKGI